MEENKETGSMPVEAENTQTDSKQQTQGNETVQTPTQETPRVLRKNGRNHSASAKKASAQVDSSENCGEVSDIKSFTEKLSGANSNGYVEGEAPERAEHRERRDFGERRERRDFGERRERGERRDFAERRHREFEGTAPEIDAAQNNDVNAEAPAEAANESDRDGPSFEEKKFSPRAIEVGLTDRRTRSFSNESRDSGVVSMTPEDCAGTPVSLWARFKEMVKSLFGKKSSKKNFHKDGKKNWKNNGKHHYNNRGKFNGDRRNGGNRRYNDRRPK